MPSDYSQIRMDNIKEYGEGTRHLAYFGRLYADRTHFVFELLQNAEDAGATQVRFRLCDDRLEVRHDGRRFDERDVRGVCGVGEGTKAQDLTQIGKFGIGFKSVYAYTQAPEVHSGDESFRIEHYVRPNAETAKPLGDPWTTLFVLSFDAEGIDPEVACQEIGDRLRGLTARTLLFLRNIHLIEYVLPDLAEGTYLREETSRGTSRQVTLIGHGGDQVEDEEWLVFDRRVRVPRNRRRVLVEVGYRIETIDEDKTERVARINDSPLVVYFPTEKDTRLGFLIQGPYRTTLSRDNIPMDDTWNKTLVAETAQLVSDTLQGLKEMGLLTVSLLQALPIRTKDFPETSMFYPIFCGVREALRTEKLLPADDRTYVASDCAKLARGEALRKLLNQDQLRSLFRTNHEIKWLTEAITRDRTPDLRKYLLDELDVEELDPARFAGMITDEFMQEQTDDWMKAFYAFAGKQRAIWRKSPYAAGPLRAKPIIRLQDGTHVAPFRGDGSPSAYLTTDTGTKTSLPIVKPLLALDPESRRFLVDLGIPKLDIVAEVVEQVLPKYLRDSPTIAREVHKQDLEMILHAYGTDSSKARERLRKQLCSTPFVLVETLEGEEPAYRRPGQVYFGSKTLREYFSGNESFACVSTRYRRRERLLLTDLGVEKSPRICRRVSNRQGYVLIKDCHGLHKRGLHGFDPDITVDGLDLALAHPTVDKSAYIWNEIVIPHSDCIRGTVETATRQNYENGRREVRDSDFGRSLMAAAWLPDRKGRMHRPKDLPLGALPRSFARDERVADRLCMVKTEVARLAEKAGVPIEDIELMRSHPAEFRKFKADILAAERKVVFPSRTSQNLVRRQETIRQQWKESPSKEYELEDRRTRTTRSTVEPDVWLRGQYTNEDDQMICQICKEEMPFRKRNGQHYFESVEMLSREHFPKEHEAQFLALCPLCAAMYKEFIKQAEERMQRLKAALVDAEDFEVPLRLGELETSLRFVETHYLAIVTILEEQTRSDVNQ